METKTDFGSTDSVVFENGKSSNYFYLSEKDPDKLVEKLDKINGEKTVIGAYALNNRHFILVHSQQKVKKIKRIKKDK